jgi:hypothetical protein
MVENSSKVGTIWRRGGGINLLCPKELIPIPVREFKTIL